MTNPDLSIIMPCYNEEAVLEYTIPLLVDAFRQSDYKLELIAVDNGSADRTGEIILNLQTIYPEIVHHRVAVNEGYGNGILQGIPKCSAPWVGNIQADGQVDAEDVVQLFRAVRAANRPVLGKVRRRFRMDGIMRKIVSVTYNLFVRILWPGLKSWDINGVPKILPRETLLAMKLTNKGWLLDPELMIKAHYMGLPVLEFNIFARMRGNGISHVRATTCWEFLHMLLIFRFSPRWRADFRAVTAGYRANNQQPIIT